MDTNNINNTTNDSNENGEIAIDDLAVMIKMGFDDVYEKFNSIEEKMVTKEEFNKAFSGMKGEIKSIKATMVTKDLFEEKITDLEMQILQVDKKIDKIDAKLTKVDKRTLEDTTALARDVIGLRKNTNLMN